uniref:Uncharacterized protein n=1 Tax=Noctiluca scintillans TaxID=2966 RepID=A0A7S1F4Y1_NOCSC|mmetsp:Transcript_34107/g.90968  ORF Transcript_34107/g.90968 Transcript_34107/m.90968 type:complete len:562 (+) Transcript_34107:61-1746(+)
MSSAFGLGCCIRRTVALILFSRTLGSGFLEHGESNLTAEDIQNDIQKAMGAALGCGGEMGAAQLNTIEKDLRKMWLTLPKNENGRIERRMFRYLAHRYFMRTSSLMVRGFEPTRVVNRSHWGAADILSQRVPGYVESVLESADAKEKGFTLEDAVTLVATLQQLIFDAESTLLELLYLEHSIPVESLITFEKLAGVLEDYTVHWMMGGDEEGAAMLLADRNLIDNTFPHWSEIVHFLKGQISAFEFTGRWRRRHSNMLSRMYSFSDAHHIVNSITKTFASFWESECVEMKNQLIDIDVSRTGRVPISKFYAASLSAEWRFGESEQYLRELGALDETSAWLGRQVIISNYMQAVSNCVVSTPHYLVCCSNLCENILGDIEAAIGASEATHFEILSVVESLTAPISIDDDSEPKLVGALTSQLASIASNGKVKLHGRLFAQWLHYVFPNECPFPHKAGAVSTATPGEYGHEFIATDEEKKHHASASNSSKLPTTESAEWMSQWNPDEELMVDTVGNAFFTRTHQGLLFCAAFLLLVIVLVSVTRRFEQGRGAPHRNPDDRTEF